LHGKRKPRKTIGKYFYHDLEKAVRVLNENGLNFIKPFINIKFRRNVEFFPDAVFPVLYGFWSHKNIGGNFLRGHIEFQVDTKDHFRVFKAGLYSR
jgi:hypothetical protein